MMEAKVEKRHKDIDSGLTLNTYEEASIMKVIETYQWKESN